MYSISKHVNIYGAIRDTIVKPLIVKKYPYQKGAPYFSLQVSGIMAYWACVLKWLPQNSLLSSFSFPLVRLNQVSLRLSRRFPWFVSKDGDNSPLYIQHILICQRLITQCRSVGKILRRCNNVLRHHSFEHLLICTAYYDINYKYIYTFSLFPIIAARIIPAATIPHKNQ